MMRKILIIFLQALRKPVHLMDIHQHDIMMEQRQKPLSFQLIILFSLSILLKEKQLN